MAIDMVQVPKPQIQLVGNVLLSNGDIVDNSNGIRVDHARTLPPVSTTEITGVSQLDKDDILTFFDSVRIIITGQVATDKPVYLRQNRPEGLGALEFEGANTYSATGAVNKDAETWYTYNGKDPVRSKSYLYTFKDWDWYDDQINSNPSGDTGGSNISSLGFVLRNSPTGNNLITIKARTYYAGRESRIAVATFKIAQKNDISEYYQPPR